MTSARDIINPYRKFLYKKKKMDYLECKEQYIELRKEELRKNINNKQVQL